MSHVLRNQAEGQFGVERTTAELQANQLIECVAVGIRGARRASLPTPLGVLPLRVADNQRDVAPYRRDRACSNQGNFEILLFGGVVGFLHQDFESVSNYRALLGQTGDLDRVVLRALSGCESREEAFLGERRTQVAKRC